jgi:glycosyltransferase involved in cell wall biosynthesis
MINVSIIIPNYNHAPYLVQRIESVVNQSYTNFEIIILDDCSTDNSREIIERFRNHPKVSKIVYNDVNSGSTFRQWKKGIEMARGEWIWIAESDDWCELNFLDVVLPKDQEDIVLSFCGSLMYRDNDIIAYPPMRYLDYTLDGVEFCKNFLNKGCYIYNASSCIFKRGNAEHIVESIDYYLAGDWHFYIKLSIKGKVQISGRVLNYFRKHNADVSGKRYKDGTWHLEFLKIQKILLSMAVISEFKYHKNLFTAYRNIQNKIADYVFRNIIQKAFRKEIGYYFYIKYLFFIIRNERKKYFGR